MECLSNLQANESSSQGSTGRGKVFFELLWNTFARLSQLGWANVGKGVSLDGFKYFS